MRRSMIIAAALVRDLIRKKDLYILAVLGMVFLVYAGRMVFFHEANVSRYFREAAQSIVLLFSLFVSVPFTAKLMIEETREGTIYPLLAKPVTRAEVVAGKYLGALLVSGSAFSLFYAIFMLAALLTRESVPLILYAQAYLFGILMLGLLCAVVLLLSMCMTFAASVTLGYLVYFLMSWFGAAMREQFLALPVVGPVIYYILPHFEFFDIRHRLVHVWEPLPVWVVLTVTAYAVIYSGLLVAWAQAIFKRKWL